MRTKAKRTSVEIRRHAFYWSSGISFILIIIVGVLALLISAEIPWQYDLTKDKLFTLSKGSLHILDQIEDEYEQVNIAAIYQSGKEDQLVKNLLSAYDDSSEFLSVEFIDIDREPSKLAKYQLNVSSINNMTLIIQSSKRTKMVYQTSMYYQTPSGNAFQGEKLISSAIAYTVTSDLPVVYITEGHNETALSELSGLMSLLELEAYQSKTLDLVRVGKVPKEASMVMIVSPKVDFTTTEIEGLEHYLLTGGKLMILVDAMNTQGTVLPNLNTFLHTYGIDITNNFIVEEDPNSHMGDNSLYLIPSYVYHPITKELANERRYPLLPIALGLRSLPVAEHITTSPLLASSAASRMRFDLSNESLKKIDTDIEGPITIASSVMINNARKGYSDGRMIVMGNSRWIYNDYLGSQSNSDFFMSSLNWLYGSRQTVSLSPKIINADTLHITGADLSKLMLICIVIIPAICLAGAFALWLTRRNL